ncbi:hypothetical protein ACO2Q2_13395 [Dyella sp. KRB-257]|uniref:DUF7940 domain-containing protein n=1 Tax=Dyella sp. KRB-257 TaxID=3400915 RepID=UPI003C12337B
MKLIDDWKQAHKFGSVQIAGSGALLGYLAAGLIASGAAAQWVGLIPMWAVFGLGAFICTLVVLARILQRSPKHDETDEAGA